MRIKYMKLKNIGPYYNEHLFDLTTNASNNIVLFGGKNGAGKTTFLKSIKFGLFGCFALGLKTETDAYFEAISNLINNKAKTDAYIEINFQIVEQLVEYNYIIKRSWNRYKNEILEHVDVVLNNQRLSEFEAKEILDKIKSITSPKLINSYIYDGEEVASIIANGGVSEFLEDTFNSIFGINLVNQAKEDLSKYLASQAETSKRQDMMDNVRVLNTINGLKSRIKNNENDIKTIKEIINGLEIKKKSLINDFIRLGGLTKDQFRELNAKIANFESEKDKYNKTIKEFIEADLPLYLCADSINKVVMYAKKEQSNKYLTYIDEISEFLKKDLTNIKRELEKSIKKVEVIYGLDEENISAISSHLSEVKKKAKDVQKILSNKTDKLDEYKLMKNSIVNNSQIEKIDKILNEISSIDLSIANNEEVLSKIIEDNNALVKELNINYEVYEKITAEMKKSRGDNNSYIVANDAIRAFDKLNNYIIVKNKVKVASAALDVFNKTVAKQNYIQQIIINEDFSISIINGAGIEISPKILSAGEMQLLVSSLIWAMFKVSNRREMFVFDTPLARLDKENRISFIKNIVSTISQQVAVLSTDSEFVGDNLMAVNDRIARTYLLNYNDKTKTTTVSEKYFSVEA